MPNNRISPEILSTALRQDRREDAPRTSLLARVRARLRADQYDRMLAVGVAAPAGSALAVHQARLTSAAEREAVARALRQVARDARSDRAPMSSRIPVNAPNIVGAADVIDAVTVRLHSPRPVGARGVARVRRLLADGSGPLYRYGSGDLTGRLGAALAAL
jgi:hypothetical protein